MSACANSGRRGIRHALGACALLLAGLLATACDDSGPVDDVFLFEGRVAYQGRTQHSLVTMDEGIARFEILALDPILFDATFGRTITVGIGVGRPDGDECPASFRSNARVGSVFSIGLEKETEYCVEIFDPGTLPEDALIAYTVSVSPA